MFRSRGANHRSTYALLFLNVAFFLLQYQDSEKFVRLFAFDRTALAAGEVWRLFTYQFMQAGRIGVWTIPPAFVLFLNLILLTLMGTSIEEEWGTAHFMRFYLLSNLVTVAIAAYLNTPIIGSFFINFTLLFVYAALFRNQVFYLLVIPIRVTFLAWLALLALVLGIFMGNRGNIAALVGAAFGYAYYLSQRVRVAAAAPSGFAAPPIDAEEMIIRTATRNIARVAAMKKALKAASDVEIDRLIEVAEREIVRGVNICPPADFKPESSDRYCVRCEGFAECSARHLRLNRPLTEMSAEMSMEPEQAEAS
jgi:membrane associated rhomboid family serine protease